MPGVPTLVPPPAAVSPDPVPTIELDPEFEARWAKWAKGGHTHEGAVRRKLVMLGAVLAVVAAVAYTLTR